jgi:hypothetical protein
MVKVLLLFIALTTSFFARAQVNFTASVNSNAVSTDDRIRLEFTANAEGKIKYPDLSAFEVISGPYTSSQSSITIINGQMKQEAQYTHVLILMPKKEGSFVIEPATYTVSGKAYKSNEIKIQVSKGQGNTSQSSQSGTPNIQNNQSLSCSITLNKTTVYQGESVIATYKVYSPYQFYQLSDFRPGSNSGFFSREIDLNLKNNTYEIQQETINGRRYFSILLRKELLIPQTSGQLKLEPFAVEMIMINGRGFFSSTFAESAKSNAPVITVKPLPAPPDDFIGIVGNITLSTDISKTEMKADEGFDYTIKINGSGNIQFSDEPKLKLPTEFEIYEPEEQSNITTGINGMQGSRTYKYFIVPRIHGTYTEIPVTISYFDPTTGTYKKLESEPVNLTIERGSGNSNTTTAGSMSPQKKEIITEKEMRYIQLEDDSITEKETIFSSWFLAAASLPLLALGFLFIAEPRLKKQKTTVELKSMRSRKELKLAQKLLTENKHKECIAAIETAMNEWIQGKTGISMSELSKETAAARFVQMGIQSDDIVLWKKIITECEMARYGLFAETNCEQLLSDTEKLINHLEKQLS